jgi:hypothetical protein
MTLQYVDIDSGIEVVSAPFSDEVKSQIEHIVVEILYGHIGYDHRLSRGDFRTKISQRWYDSQGSFLVLSDRKMRQLVEDLRCQDGPGCRICSTSGNGGGYFMAESYQELLRNITDDLKKANSIYERCDIQRKNSAAFFAINDFDSLRQAQLFGSDD